jgi:uncharacterized protein (TIGR02246 family)
MKPIVMLCAAGAALILMGCAATAPDTHDADVKALKDLEAQWNQEFAAKDLEKMMGNYTTDGDLLASNAPIASTLDARRASFKQMLDDPNFHLQFAATKVEVAKSGDIAYTEGTYTMTLTDPATKQPMTDKGKYVTVYKKQPDGGWKAVEDIQNTDLPMPAPPPPTMSSTKKK